MFWQKDTKFYAALLKHFSPSHDGENLDYGPSYNL